MSESERTAITNWDDTAPREVDVVETTTPWIFWVVVVNADGTSA
jgi:hypothetical protein